MRADRNDAMSQSEKRGHRIVELMKGANVG